MISAHGRPSDCPVMGKMCVSIPSRACSRAQTATHSRCTWQVATPGTLSPCGTARQTPERTLLLRTPYSILIPRYDVGRHWGPGRQLHLDPASTSHVCRAKKAYWRSFTCLFFILIPSPFPHFIPACLALSEIGRASRASLATPHVFTLGGSSCPPHEHANYRILREANSTAPMIRFMDH